jgi:hypothetical protein
MYQGGYQLPGVRLGACFEHGIKGDVAQNLMLQAVLWERGMGIGARINSRTWTYTDVESQKLNRLQAMIG